MVHPSRLVKVGFLAQHEGHVIHLEKQRKLVGRRVEVYEDVLLEQLLPDLDQECPGPSGC